MRMGPSFIGSVPAHVVSTADRLLLLLPPLLVLSMLTLNHTPRWGKYPATTATAASFLSPTAVAPNEFLAT